MKYIKIVDYLFSHAKYSTDFQESKYIEWDRDPLSLNDEYIFYTDNSLDRVTNNSNTIAWLLESLYINNRTSKNKIYKQYKILTLFNYF